MPVIIGWDDGFYATDHHHLTRALLDSSLSADEKIVYLTIQQDLSHLNEADFWTNMVKEGYTWLNDENGRAPVSPFHLADDMNGLRNDYYRSLSYFVRTYGGYAKSNSSYAEFVWANWFRKMLPLPWPTITNFTSLYTHNDLPSTTSHYGTEAAQRKDQKMVRAHLAAFEAPATVKWNPCEVFPYEAPCLNNEVQTLLSNLNRAIQLAQSPIAKGLPGWGQGTAEEPNCNLNTLQEYMDKMKAHKHHKKGQRKFKKASL